MTREPVCIRTFADYAKRGCCKRNPSYRIFTFRKLFWRHAELCSHAERL